jgi:hypothetical protein
MFLRGREKEMVTTAAIHAVEHASRGFWGRGCSPNILSGEANIFAYKTYILVVQDLFNIF